jgi:hypothetical protein
MIQVLLPLPFVSVSLYPAHIRECYLMLPPHIAECTRHERLAESFLGECTRPHIGTLPLCRHSP